LSEYSGMSQTAAAAGSAAAGAPLMTQKGPRDRSHPVRLYVERVASQDLGDYPEWDPTVSTLLSYIYVINDLSVF